MTRVDETRTGVNGSVKGEIAGRKYITSDTFEPTGRRLGYGCWGTVDVYRNKTTEKSEEWAIKVFEPNEVAREQMRQRGWTEEDVMRREAIPLDAAHHHVVPRLIERDKKGRLYAAMPVYDRTLADRIGNKGYFYNWANEKNRVRDVLKIARDVADALSYMHNTRAHADIKPTNILMKDGRAYLGDLGSSTCISISDEGNSRGKFGDRNYRAPECFDEKANPSRGADIFSFGSVLYEMLTGEKIYDGSDKIWEESEKQFNKFIRRKLKKTPLKLRKFLRKTLAYDPADRFFSGSQVLGELERTINNLSILSGFRRYAKVVVPSLAAAAFFSYASYKVSTHEPTELGMPTTTRRTEGMLYKPSATTMPSLEIVAEDIPDLPEAQKFLGMAGGEVNGMAKRVTENRVVAYFLKTCGQAQVVYNRAGPRTENQWRDFLETTIKDEREHLIVVGGQVWPVWAKSIEVSMDKAQIEKGVVDLEDVMAISRLGIETVSRAKRAANSQDWKDYRDAKDSKGEEIIPRREKEFINYWIAYYHADVN